MINTRFIWYLEKSRLLDKSQCGFRKHSSTIDHLLTLARYLRDTLAQRQQAVGLFFDLEKAYETSWQYGIVRDPYRIGLRDRLPIFVSEYLRDRWIQARIRTTLSYEFYPEEGVPIGGLLAVAWFGLNELPSCIVRDILRAHFCQSISQQSSLGYGGTRTSHSRSTSICYSHSARRLSTSSKWLLIWSGKETETHFWCCTRPFFAPSWTMVALCMAQHQTPI